jgi:hypothetical protein
MSVKNNDDVSPESLMESFKGVSMMKMVVITLVFHAVVVGGSSVSFLKKSLVKDDGTKTKEERVTKAMVEATSALRKIAVENGLNPQDISDQFAAGSVRAPREAATNVVPEAAAVPAPVPASTNQAVPVAVSAETNAAERPKSEYEKNLEKSAKGPDMPSAVPKDDIF